MTTPNDQPPGLSLGLSDILFIFFRRKWIVLGSLALGAAAAGVIYKVSVPRYYSTSKLLVRYVTDSKGPDAEDPSEIVRSPTFRFMGESILNSEVELISNQDTLARAAEKTGVSRVIGDEKNTNVFAAAGVLGGGLIVLPGKNNPIITVKLGHKDPEVARIALGHLLKEYLAKHVEIHRSSGTYEFLQDQTEQIRFRLRDIEDELRREKAKLNVTSIGEAKAELLRWRSELLKNIAETEFSLAEQESRLASSPIPVPESVTNTTAPVATADIDPERADRFKLLFDKLNVLRSKEVELLSTFKEEGTPVQQVRQQMAAVEKSIEDLGFGPQAALRSRSGSPAAAPALLPFELGVGKDSVAALKARLNSLRGQIEKLDLKLKEIDAAEGPIVALQRRRDLTEDLYTYFSKNLERARIDQTIDTEKLNNITVIQDPTRATKDGSELQKLLAIGFGGCLGAGLALAFVLEVFLDPTFKRRKEVESHLRIPVFATIPNFGRNGHSKLKVADEAAGVPALANGEIAPWSEEDPMLPYYEALRDRLVMSYGDDIHKPKIVGLTSCNKGAGVSRIATGLAASLSRDVERNVLLIGLERGKVAVSAFAKGRPADFHAHVESSASMSDAENSQTPVPSDAFVRENLFSLARTGRNVMGASIVQSFSDLMPKLKNSEYDFIIFDLPHIDQTSGALRLASQMERTVLVVEAEKSSREQLKRARTLLGGASRGLVALLNKTKSYGPRSLDQEL